MIPLSYSIPTALTALCKIRDYYSQFPFVRRCAIQFGQPQFDNDLASFVANLPNFVRQKMTYVPDPQGFEFVTAPDVLLADIVQQGTAYGDCDDHVLLLNTMLASVGFRTAFVAVKIDPHSETFDHVITAYFYQGAWVNCDPCAKSVIQPVYVEQFAVQNA